MFTNKLFIAINHSKKDTHNTFTDPVSKQLLEKATFLRKISVTYNWQRGLMNALKAAVEVFEPLSKDLYFMMSTFSIL